MIQFKPYPSIGNAADAAWMAQVRDVVPEGTQWAVQEKVDGANVAFLCDDLDVRMARRRAILERQEKFFDYEDMLDRYSGNIYYIFNLIRLAHPEAKSIAVYGELFGGVYPHPDVPAGRSVKPVQLGIWYAPGYDFYAFDIYVFTGQDEGFFLPVIEANTLFSSAGLIYARNLFVGSLEECLSYPCAFQTVIPMELGLPSIENNLSEGVIIKPLSPVHLHDGSRVAVKVKRALSTAS
jgi:Rnl2 family RNA ligase